MTRYNGNLSNAHGEVMTKFEEAMDDWKIVPKTEQEDDTFDESSFMQKLVDAGKDRCIAVVKHYMTHFAYTKKQKAKTLAVLSRQDVAELIVELQRKHEIEPKHILKMLKQIDTEEEEPKKTQKRATSTPATADRARVRVGSPTSTRSVASSSRSQAGDVQAAPSPSGATDAGPDQQYGSRFEASYLSKLGEIRETRRTREAREAQRGRSRSIV